MTPTEREAIKVVSKCGHDPLVPECPDCFDFLYTYSKTAQADVARLLDEVAALEKTEKPPSWYEERSTALWLNRECPDIAHRAAFVVEHLQKAFEKGWAMRVSVAATRREGAMVKLLQQCGAVMAGCHSAPKQTNAYHRCYRHANHNRKLSPHKCHFCSQEWEVFSCQPGGA